MEGTKAEVTEVVEMDAERGATQIRKDKWAVKELEMSDLKALAKFWGLATQQVLAVSTDIINGDLEDGQRVKLKLEITFAIEGDGVDVSCSGGVSLPKYYSESLRALKRLGKLKYFPAEQATLPGIKGRRTDKE